MVNIQALLLHRISALMQWLHAIYCIYAIVADVKSPRLAIRLDSDMACAAGGTQTVLIGRVADSRQE